MGMGTERVGILNCYLFLFILILLPSHYYCTHIYSISYLLPLVHGQSLVSPGLIFELGFFIPNGSANQYVGLWHYKNISPRKVVWVANREKPLADTDTLASLRISSSGNLELVDGQQNTVWSTNVTVIQVSSSKKAGSVVAVLSDDGNFVVKDVVAAGQSIWQSFNHPSDTLLPTQLLGFDTKYGTNNVLTSWRSNKDASMGKFMVGVSAESPPQLFVWMNGSIPYYRSGPWDKSKFIGIQIMDDRYHSGFTLYDDLIQGQTYFSFNFFDTLSYLYVSPEGQSKLMVALDGKNWILGNPRNPCSRFYGKCGPFGTCNPSESPICKCLKGFVPKSDVEWSKGNWTGGCARRNKLFCQRDTSKPVSSRGKHNDDGFWKMERLKVPDSHEFVESALDAKTTSDECNMWCLNNCSCLAYGFVSKIGCLVWSKDLLDIQEFSSHGEDLFIRLARAELGKGKSVKLISSLTAISSVSILFAIVIIWYRLQAKRKESGQIQSTTQQFELTDSIQTSDIREYIGKHDDLSELLIYDFNTISIATENFSITNKLGQGGFGPVYKGTLHEGKEIAVKRLSSNSGQGIEEFKNEMLLISNLQHKNLVRIMGYCIKGEEKLLIYEFMANKSVDNFLFDETRRAELDWGKRFNIIQGVARGLLYLHHDSYLKVIHRDLKVSNILLDEKMNPKISDFGLARIVQEAQDLENTQKVVGTRGYMSPEYAMGGIFSEKSDVYSFGVLVLEIVSSKKNTSFCIPDQQLGFLAYAWHLWDEGRGLELVDEVLADSYSSSEVMRCIHTGLLCIQDNAVDRPTMPDVLLMLSTDTDLPRPTRPVFTIQNSVFHPQPQYKRICSTNEATVTVIEGR